MGFKIAKKGIYKNYKYVIAEVELTPYYHVNGYVKLKDNSKFLEDDYDDIPDYGLDKATLKDHINKITQIAQIDSKYLIFSAEGVQFYNKNGDLVTYDIKTLKQIKP